VRWGPNQRKVARLAAHREGQTAATSRWNPKRSDGLRRPRPVKQVRGDMGEATMCLGVAGIVWEKENGGGALGGYYSRGGDVDRWKEEGKNKGGGPVGQHCMDMGHEVGHGSDPVPAEVSYSWGVVPRTSPCRGVTREGRCGALAGGLRRGAGPGCSGRERADGWGHPMVGPIHQ
jgi:hypothetical protein